MKLIVVLSLVAVAAARPQEFFDDVNRPAPKTLEEAGILRMEMNMNEDGSFQYGYETTDPAQQDVTGEQRQIGEEIGTVMQGSYSYTSPEGQLVEVNWIADENGFQPRGDVIPQGAGAREAPVFDDFGGFEK